MSERDIFLAAVEIADPDERGAYLDQACEGDGQLRLQVEALLQTHEQTSQFLETPAAAASALVDQTMASDTLADAGAVPYSGAATVIDERDLSDEIPLGFLSPSEREDSLGRLKQYEILEVVGRGAFGIVLKGFDENLKRVVAIKVLSPDLAATSPARKRFQREAELSAAVRHENVVSIYDVKNDPLPYLVMEYIPGETLQQRLDSTGPLEVVDVLRLGKQIADGLAAAHAQGLIHRDIKPGNILLETGINDHVKVTDFGLARAADDASMTRSGVIAGTPMYMAPEQALGHKLDQRADLFSFGSVLYQMLSGRPPFRAPNTMAVLKRVTEDTPRPIREIIPEVPIWMCEIVGKLHEKNPDDRFSSAQEVSELLGQHLAHVLEPHAVPQPPAVERSSQTLQAQAADVHARLQGPARGLIATACLNWIGLLALLVIAIISFAGSGDAPLGGVGWFVIPLLAAATAVILIGGLQLKRGESYGWCLAAGVTAMLIGPGYILGWPIGIWTLYLLTRPEVRESFRQRSQSSPVKPHALWRPLLGAAVPICLITGVAWTLRDRDIRDPADFGTAPPSPNILSHDESSPATSSLSQLSELTDLITLAEADRDDVKRLFESGVATAHELAEAEIQVAEAKLKLAEAEHDWPAQEGEFARLLSLHDDQLARIETLHNEGVATQAELRAAERSVLEIRTRWNTARVGVGLPEISYPADAPPTAISARDWTPLFNGQDLTGWKTHPELPGQWDVADGVLTGQGERSYLFTDRHNFANFHLRVEAKVSGNGDAGIWLRAPYAMRHGPQAWMIQPASGYEVELFNSPEPVGSIWEVVPGVRPNLLGRAAREQPIQADVWFTLEVIAQQNRLITRVNGKEVLDCTDAFNRFQAGHLALAVSEPQTRIQFRKIEIQELPPFDPSVPINEHRSFAGDEWIDVIPLIDPGLDKWDLNVTGKNEWRIENGELLVGEADDQANKLLLPLDSDWNAFACEIEFTRRHGEDGFIVNVPKRNSGDFPVAWDPPDTVGLFLSRKSSGATLAEGPQIETGNRTTLRLEVRRQGNTDHIVASVDGEQVGEWTGNKESLSGTDGEGYPHHRLLSLWTFPGETEFTFHAIRVKLLDGTTATMVRPTLEQPGTSGSTD